MYQRVSPTLAPPQPSASLRLKGSDATAPNSRTYEELQTCDRPAEALSQKVAVAGLGPIRPSGESSASMRLMSLSSRRNSSAPIFSLKALSRELNLAARNLEVPILAHAAVAARHVWNASSRRTRSVRREVRWRCTLKVFWTAA
jgi:hypothetical protein